MSLYGRLFTYRQREGKAPLENFLSEALADLLGRVPAEIGREIVAEMLGGAPEVVETLAAIWPDGAAVSWSTQYAIVVRDSTRYIDVVLELDDTPVLAIENKVAAGFQNDQLADYSRWIAEAAPPDWGGAAILLTHTTTAPEDFLAPERTGASRFAAVARWSALARQLGDLIAGNDEPSPWQALARELHLFLEEQGMTTEYMNAQDLAALQLYVRSSAKMTGTLWALWEPVHGTLKTVTKGYNWGPDFSAEDGCVEVKRYVAAADYGSSWVSVGIRFPDLNPNLYPDIATGLAQVYINVSVDNARPAIGELLSLPKPWLSSGPDWIAALDIKGLTDPHAFVAQAQTWLGDRAAELRDQIVAAGLG